MYTYDIEWCVNDHGTKVKSLLLHLPEPVNIVDVKPECFSVFVERKDENGNIMSFQPSFTKEEIIKAYGYRHILAAYPSDIYGNPMRSSSYVTLELDVEDAQAGAIIGGIFASKFVSCEHRIVQIAPIGDLCGLMFDKLGEIRCPQTVGWSHGRSTYERMPLRYGFYQPQTAGERPLIIWLHGAGEGGTDIRTAYMGNNVTALSSDTIQAYFGGAWVLVPQTETMWMDDGTHTYGHTGKSMYTEALKALIDEFADIHSVDKDRIYIGGCSNGGFMSMRMVFDYPHYFAAAYPMCEALYDDTLSDEDIEAVKNVPIWMLHAMTDGIVDPEETSVPTYKRLIAAGAPDVHLTYIDDRPPFEMVNHGCWIQGLRDERNVDFDGQPVLVDGRPVTRFQWVAAQKRK